MPPTRMGAGRVRVTRPRQSHAIRRGNATLYGSPWHRALSFPLHHNTNWGIFATAASHLPTAPQNEPSKAAQWFTDTLLRHCAKDTRTLVCQ